MKSLENYTTRELEQELEKRRKAKQKSKEDEIKRLEEKLEKLNNSVIDWVGYDK